MAFRHKYRLTILKLYYIETIYIETKISRELHDFVQTNV